MPAFYHCFRASSCASRSRLARRWCTFSSRALMRSSLLLRRAKSFPRFCAWFVSGSPLLEKLQDIYDKLVAKKRLDKYAKDCKAETDALIAEIKTFLGLYGALF